MFVMLARQLATRCSTSHSPTAMRSAFRAAPCPLAVPVCQQRPLSMRAADLPEKVLAKARKLALVVGSAAGAFGSLVGVGGGVLIAPVILNTCPGIPQRVISGTSLAAVATTGATAGYVYWSSGSVDTRYAGLLAAGAVLTAPFGARATHLFNCHTLRMALGYWLYLVAPLVPLKAAIFSRTSNSTPASTTSSSSSSTATNATTTSSSGSSSSGSTPSAVPSMSQGPTGSSSQPQPLADGSSSALRREWSAGDAAVAATGCLAGFASGLLGIGGGTVVTPLLAVFTGMPQQQVLGTSLAAMVLPSLVGLIQHQQLGNVDWRMAAALALGTMAGSYAGSCVGVTAPDGVLEMLFAGGMLLLGRQTLRGARSLAAAAAAAAR